MIPLYIFRWLSQLVDPQEIIECTASHEQAHMNGSRLQIKDLWLVDSKTVVASFKVSTATPKESILAELKKNWIAVQGMAKADNMDSDN